MQIVSFKHKGLKQLWHKNLRRGLPAQHVERIEEILDLIAAAESIEEWLSQPRGLPHALTGDRKGDYAIRVTSNMRITFTYDGESVAALNLDYEDYH